MEILRISVTPYQCFCHACLMRKPEDQTWESWVEELIREAQDQGLFDNLPGKGKPLPSRRNPFLPEEKQMAFDLIQDSGHTLPWIADGQDIERRIQAARARVREHYRWYSRRLQEASAEERSALDEVWRGHWRAFEQEVAAINRLIDDYNLKVPSVQLHKFRLILAEELRRVQEEG